jgi:hypothetical protein
MGDWNIYRSAQGPVVGDTIQKYMHIPVEFEYKHDAQWEVLSGQSTVFDCGARKSYRFLCPSLYYLWFFINVVAKTVNYI